MRCKVYGVIPTKDLQQTMLDMSRGKIAGEYIPKMTFASHKILADYATEVAHQEMLRTEAIKA